MSEPKAEEDRKSYSVWLTPRHQKMLDEMPDVRVSNLTRKAIEDLFEGRNEREFAQICIEDDLEQLAAQWERDLGVAVTPRVLSTSEGFRIVLQVLKDYAS